MALLTTQTVTKAGLAETYAAVSASDTFVPGATTILRIVNGGGSPDNCVVPVLAGDPTGETIADRAFTVTNGTAKTVGPFHPQFYADPVTGLATITHSFTTSVTVAVLNIPLS